MRADRRRAARERLTKPKTPRVLADEADYYVVLLPPGRAEGAVDSTKPRRKAKHGTPIAEPGRPYGSKRRRLSGKRRKQLQRAEDWRFRTTP